MTLQELQAELHTLSLAYPGTTVVKMVVPSHGFEDTVTLIRVDSTDTEVIVNLEA